MNDELGHGKAASADRDDGATRVLILSTVSFTLLFAVWLMFGVLSVPIKEEMHLDKIQFSWLTAIAVLSGSIWRLPFGILTDRIGGRRLFIALLLATAIPCFLVSRATTFGGLLVCALLLGVAGNSFSVGIAWNAAWASRQKQGFALGTFGAGNVGASVTKLIGPALITLVPASGLLGGRIPGGWRIVPVMYAALLLVMAAVVWIGAPAHDRTPGTGRPLRAMLAPLRQVRIWRFGLYYVVVFGAYVAFSLWLPSYYKNVYHLSLARSALLTAFFIFPASLLRPVGGWLSDRFGARPVTYTVFVVMLLASMMLAAPPGALRIPRRADARSSCSSSCWASAWAWARLRSTSTSPNTSPTTSAPPAAWLARWARWVGSFYRSDSGTSKPPAVSRELLLADDRSGAGVPAVVAPGGHRHPAAARPRARDDRGRAGRRCGSARVPSRTDPSPGSTCRYRSTCRARRRCSCCPTASPARSTTTC